MLACVAMQPMPLPSKLFAVVVSQISLGVRVPAASKFEPLAVASVYVLG